VALDYQVRGAGEPVVLTHLAPYADSFVPLMGQPGLTRYQLICYRRRAYGSSPAPTGHVTIPDNAHDLAGLLQFPGIGRAHIVRHSYGGLVALQLALERPDVAGSVVLMEPALRTAALRAGRADTAVEDLHRRMSAGFQRYRDGDREGAIEAFLGATFGPGYRQQLEQVLPGWWDQAVRTADGFFGGEVPELPSWEFGLSQARRIAAPVLSMRGSSSNPAFTAFERLLCEWFPQLETAEIAGVDHRLHRQGPEPVAAALAEFFTKHPLERGQTGLALDHQYWIQNIRICAGDFPVRIKPMTAPNGGYARADRSQRCSRRVTGVSTR
jgi:pimeloyl-ACP methyl ester carboxylesterase